MTELLKEQEGKNGGGKPSPKGKNRGKGGNDKNGGGKEKGGNDGNDLRGTNNSPYRDCPNCGKRHKGQCQKPLGFLNNQNKNQKDTVTLSKKELFQLVATS